MTAPTVRPESIRSLIPALSGFAGRGWFQLFDVTTASATTRQKKLCATNAWTIAIGIFWTGNRTLTPPSPAWNRTPTSAANAIQRNRPSLRLVQTHRVIRRVTHETAPAITLCEYSYLTFPTNWREPSTHLPNDIGQSGTESPAMLLVTSPPATRSRTVRQARKLAK